MESGSLELDSPVREENGVYFPPNMSNKDA